MKKFYAGIGSRKTPPDVLKTMTEIATMLEPQGWVLRSGGAIGADSAFEHGVQHPLNKRIYLPWHRPDKEGIICGRIPSLRDIARTYHPAWHMLTEAGEKLMTRNTPIVLGYPPEPEWSQFVVCWTPDGRGGGGTGQALRIARAYQIPIFDLAIPGTLDRFMSHVEALNALDAL